MAEMNRSYGSDIQNLLDVALRYKTAQDEKGYREAALLAEQGYREAALLAEQGYREQRAKQELGLAVLKHLADKDIESINEHNRVQEIYDKMNLDKSRLESKLKENISPDTEEIFSTAGDNLESIQAMKIKEIANRDKEKNILNQEIARWGEIENQYSKIYDVILESDKNQGLQGQYDVKFEEFLDVIAKNPYMYGGKPAELSDFEKNKAYSYMAERANQEYGELAKNTVGVPTIEDGRAVTKFVQPEVGKSYIAPPKGLNPENPTDIDKKYNIVAKALGSMLDDYMKSPENSKARKKYANNMNVYMHDAGVSYLEWKKATMTEKQFITNINNFINQYIDDGSSVGQQPNQNNQSGKIKIGF